MHTKENRTRVYAPVSRAGGIFPPQELHSSARNLFSVDKRKLLMQIVGVSAKPVLSGLEASAAAVISLAGPHVESFKAELRQE